MRRWAGLIAFTTVAVVESPAQLIFSAFNAPQTIDFQSAISNVLSFHSTISYGAIRETYADWGASYSDQLNLRSLGWSVRASGINIAGNGSGNWTPFAAEIEVPPDSSQDHFVVNDMAPAAPQGSYSGTFRQTIVMGNAGDPNRGWALGNDTASPWRDFGLTLRSLNSVGSDAAGFTFSLDAWYGDPDTQLSDLVLSYSTDNSTYTTITTLNGFRTTTATFDRFNISHWSSNFAPSGTVSVTIPDGSYLYFRIESLRAGSSGSGGYWVLDNIQLALVPEPATAGLLLSVLPVLWVRRRRMANLPR